MIEELKRLLSQFSLDTSEEMFKEVIEFLPAFLEKNEMLYVAGTKESDGFSFVQVENGDKNYFLCFTDPTESVADVLGFEAGKLFKAVEEDVEAEGLIINPHSDCFVVDSKLLSLLLDLTLYRTTPPAMMN